MKFTTYSPAYFIVSFKGNDYFLSKIDGNEDG